MDITIFLSFLLISSSPKLLVRVYDTPQSVAGLDIAGSKRGEWVDVVVTQEELHALSGKSMQILDHDIEKSVGALKEYYHSYPGFVDTLMQIVANHPEIARLDTIGVSWEGREILAVKISDNVAIDEDEPELLFDGLHHSREWPALEIPLFFVDTLTRGYGNNLNITEAVNRNEIWIVPCMNPDGYIFSHDEGHFMWRKNRRYFPEHGTYGVDPNRNYNGTCNGDPWGAWGAIDHRKASFDLTSNIFCGDAPFSEYETQAIRDLVADHEFTFYITYHTYGEMIIWSWGYTAQRAPDSTMLSDIGNGMAQRVRRMGGTSIYDAYQACDLYPTSGTAQEWGYGYGLYVQGMPILAYTVEACTCFHPDVDLAQVVRENFEGAMYLFEIAGSVRSQMVPWMVPPDIEPVDTVGPDFHLHWEKRAADKYALEELRALSVIEDDAEDPSDLWIFEGFSRSTDYSHSGSYSYISRGSCDTVAIMTTAYPLPIADSLVFWCDYTILASDYAFVEVSGTGKEWEFLDGFTGNSQGWERKSYALPPHKSLYTRFRFTAAAISLREDFRVDDIYPVPRFDTIATVSDSIGDTSCVVTGRLPGDYWYRVKGHNSRAWGDFGELEDVIVVESGVEETNRQLAIGNCQLSIYPNPCTQVSGVRFDLPALPDGREQAGVLGTNSSHLTPLTLKIYDLGGRLVRTFHLTNYQSPFSSEGGSPPEADEPLAHASGGNQITWDARDCGSGIYFVVLDAGDFRKSAKVTLIKR